MFALWFWSRRDWGGEVSRSVIGRDRLTLLSSLRCYWPSAQEQRSMVADFLCVPVLADPLQNREAQTRDEFGRIFPRCAKKPWHKITCVMALISQTLYSKCCNTGGTNSALCLSSARIWSLGFREYLQMIKKGKKKEYNINYCKRYIS